MPHVHACGVTYLAVKLSIVLQNPWYWENYTLWPSKYSDLGNLILSQNTVLLIRLKRCFHENCVCAHAVTVITNSVALQWMYLGDLCIGICSTWRPSKTPHLTVISTMPGHFWKCIFHFDESFDFKQTLLLMKTRIQVAT